MNKAKLISVASGRSKADLVLKNANIIQVLTGEIIKADIAITDRYIAGVGNYSGKKEVDLDGKYVSPGFINAHCHVESSMALPQVYCKEELRHGVTTVITDPHEIANVCGVDGIQFMLDSTKNVKMNYFVQVPSCVPSTDMETSGAVLNAESLKPFLNCDRVLGLGEVMNYEGVKNAQSDLLEKISAYKDKIIDGHMPIVTQDFVQSYGAAGIQTDHESVDFEQALEKLRAGIAVLVRQGSGSKNLEKIMRGVIKSKIDTSRLAFCTDDKHLLDIHNEGTVRKNIQMSISLGLNPVTAYQIATINAARIFNLKNKGAVAPGYKADLVVLDSIEDVNISEVYFNGEKVDFLPQENYQVPPKIMNTVNFAPLSKESLRIENRDKYSVIQMIPNEIITNKLVMDKNQVDENLKNSNLLKLAVVERHNATGNIGIGLLSNYGLKGGAIATTVAHDSHNLIIAGDNDEDMILAAEELKRVQGGYTIVKNGKVMDTLPLPVGGLMSLYDWEELSEKIEKLKNIAYDMGVNNNMDPFIALSFLALPVLPQIRLTDKGLVQLD